VIRALEVGEKCWHDLFTLFGIRVQVHWYFHGGHKFRPWKPRRYGCVHCKHFAKGPALVALAEISQECGVRNWGGNQEAAVSLAALREAELLIRLVPYDIANPELAVTPSGAIAFEWIRGPGNRVMLTVSGSRKLAYAALIPPAGQEHGSEPFVDSLPERVERLISKFKRHSEP
jgi:hypothetical protein